MGYADNFASRGADNLAEVRRVTISELERIAILVSNRKWDDADSAIHDLLVMLKTR